MLCCQVLPPNPVCCQVLTLDESLETGRSSTFKQKKCNNQLPNTKVAVHVSKIRILSLLRLQFPRSYRKFVTFLIPYDHFCHSFNSKTLIVHNLSTLVSLLTPFKDKKTSEINILNNLYNYHLLQNSFMSRKKLTSVDSSTIKNWV